MFSRLQYITDSPQLTELACKAGVRWIQARVKNKDEKTWLEIANDIAKICRNYNVTYVVNDNLDIALKVKANGVHLGKKDRHIPEARAILKNRKIIIGGSANTFEDVMQLNLQKVDYIGLGPLRLTSTKKDLNPVLGLNGYELVMEEAESAGINMPPIYAIGGIQSADVEDLLETGIYGVAVSSAISNAKNINIAMQEFYTALGEKN